MPRRPLDANEPAKGNLGRKLANLRGPPSGNLQSGGLASSSAQSNQSEVPPGWDQTLPPARKTDAAALVNAQRLSVAHFNIRRANSCLDEIAVNPNAAERVKNLLKEVMNILIPLRQLSTRAEDAGICLCLNMYNGVVTMASQKGLQTPDGFRPLTNITAKHFVDKREQVRTATTRLDYSAAETLCQQLLQMVKAYKTVVARGDWRLTEVNEIKAEISHTHALCQGIRGLRDIAKEVSSPEFYATPDSTSRLQKLLDGFTWLAGKVVSQEQLPSDLRDLYNNGSIRWDAMTYSHYFTGRPINYNAPAGHSHNLRN